MLIKMFLTLVYFNTFIEYHKTLTIMIRTLLFVLSLFSVSIISLHSQENDVDKLNKKIDSTLRYTPKKNIKKVIHSLYSTPNAEAYIISFINYLPKDDIDNLRYAHHLMGYVYYQTSQYNKAIIHVNKAIEKATVLSDTTALADAYNLKGGICNKINNLEVTLQCYIEEEKLISHKKNSLRNLMVKANIGIVKVELERYKSAFEVLNEVEEAIKKELVESNNKQLQDLYVRVLVSKGICLEELGKLEEGLSNNKKGIALCKTPSLLSTKANFYINTGHIYFKKKEYYKAVGYLEEGKKILMELPSENLPNILLCDYFIAECFFELKKYDDALLILTSNFKKIKNQKIERVKKLDKMYQLAIQIADLQQNQNLSLTLHTNYNVLLSKINEDQVKSRDILYDRDISKLKADNELLVNQNYRGKINTTIVLVFSLLVLVIALLMMRKKSNEKREQFKVAASFFQEKIEIPETKPVVTSSIKEDKVKTIIKKLQKLESTSFFFSKDCNLYTTAKKIHTNTSYLSKTLNTYKKQSFNQYLNEVRINKVILQLKDDLKFRSYTIEAIAQEMGYKSSNTFVKAFKEKTKLNPSCYIKNIENNVISKEKITTAL